MRTGLTISTLLHLALLVWLLVTLPSTKIESTEAIPVDMISDTELTQITAGLKTGEKTPTPKPIVDKVADETKTVKDPTAKVSDKPEIAPTAAAAPPPPPAPKPPETKPPEAKPPEPQPEKAEAKPDKPEPDVDAIAEALKREEAKKKEEAKKLAEAKKREEAKKKEEARKREEAKKREQEKFDAASIESRLALLDRRAPQRNAATGASLNQVASIGAPTGAAATLSVSELAALQARLRDCWDVPVGVQNARDLIVTVRIQFRKDGALAADPMVMNRSGAPLFQVAAEAAVRGIRKCAPYTFMPPAKYDVWKDVEVNFDPREMFGG
jgi:outer membrane biosynthesis protein TonB